MHHGLYHPAFSSILNSKGYYDIFLVNTQGDVVYTVAKEADFTTNLLNGQYKDSGLAEAFREAATDAPGTVHYSDLAPYAPSNDIPASFMSTQILNQDGEYVGVLVLQLPVGMFNHIVNNPVGLGETGEVFLIAEDFTTRTASRFENGLGALEQVAHSEQIEFGLQGHSGFFGNAVGVDGEPVIAYSASLEFPEGHWALVAQQSLAEVMGPVKAERNILILASLACAALLSFAGWLFSRTITRPIDSLCTTMEKVAHGELDADVPEAERRDDFGKIGKTLLSMRDDLRQAHEAEE